MNKLLLFLGLITIVSMTACSNEIAADNVIKEERTLSFDESIHFKNVVDSVNKNSYRYIRSGKTRAINNGNSEGIELTSEEEKVLKANEELLIAASYDLFESIGLSKDEIKNEIGEENDEAVVYASLIAISAIQDNAQMTRSVTGNVYIDCALSVLGLDLVSSVRTAISKGISKKVALRLVEHAVKAAVGTSYAAVITVGLWGLCVGGIG